MLYIGGDIKANYWIYNSREKEGIEIAMVRSGDRKWTKEVLE